MRIRKALIFLFMIFYIFSGCASNEIKVDKVIVPKDKERQSEVKKAQLQPKSEEMVKQKIGKSADNRPMPELDAKFADKGMSSRNAESIKNKESLMPEHSMSDSKVRAMSDKLVERSDKVVKREIIAEFGKAKVAKAEVSEAFESVAMEKYVPGKSEKIKAGTCDDNEELAYYMKFLNDKNSLTCPKANVDGRIILLLTDANGESIYNSAVKVERAGKTFFEGKTYASGENLFYDNGRNADKYDVSVDYMNKKYSIKASRDIDGYLRVKLPVTRQETVTPSVDVVFLIDSTGSMSDEIDSLKDTIYAIHTQLTKLEVTPNIRFGMVLYRDKSDQYLTKDYDFTDNIDLFQQNLNEVKASGGGDTPEDLNSGLEEVLTKMKWKDDAVKIVFLIGDAPPHTDYGQNNDYVWAMDNASKRAIKIYTIGASGLPIIGEYIYRNIAQRTCSQFIFLTYGEKGESSGAATVADPGKVSHHTGSNYEVNTLDNIIVRIVKKEIAYLLSPKLRIPFEITPESQVEHINDRLYNIIAQLFGQLNESKITNPTVVVCPVETKDDRLTVLGIYLQGVATEQLLKDKLATVIEREKLDKLMEELKLSLSGLTEKPQEAGKLLNAGYFIFSNMGYLGDECVLQMRVIDAKSSMVVAAARIRI